MENSLTRSSANAWKRPPKAEPLEADFFAGHTIEVARALLGKVFAVRPEGGAAHETRAMRIVETEAYRAGDPASHSCRGPTPRSQIMFEDPGRAYVYFIYGMYEMLNFVTEPAGEAGAVLIRAGEPLTPGLAATNGPGKLCRALGIQRTDNGRMLTGRRFTLFDDGYAATRVMASPRVGITQAKDRLWRFYLADHASVSRSPQNREGQLLTPTLWKRILREAA